MVRTGWDRVAVAALLATVAVMIHRAEALELPSGHRIGETTIEAAGTPAKTSSDRLAADTAGLPRDCDQLAAIPPQETPGPAR